MMKNIIKIVAVTVLLGTLAGCAGFAVPMGPYGGGGDDGGYAVAPGFFPGFGGMGYGGGDGDGD